MLASALPAVDRSYEHVLEDGHGRGDLDELKSPGHSLSRDLMGLEPHEIPFTKADRSPVRLIDAGHHIEERALSRPVRAYQPQDLSLIEPEGDILKYLQTAKGLVEMLYLEKHAVPFIRLFDPYARQKKKSLPCPTTGKGGSITSDAR